MYYIPQITSNDCLFTAFKILLANVKKKEDFLFLQEDENHGPYSFMEIIEKGKEYGIELFGFEAEEKSELLNCKNIPLILTIKKGGKVLHSVYVYKVTKYKVYYLDSDSGKVVMPFNKFIELWDGKGLMTRKIVEVDKEPRTIDLKPAKSALTIVFQTCSAICFILGISFIDSSWTVFIPVGLIVLGLIFEVITKITQIIDMKRFDKQTNELLKQMDNKNFLEFLPRREKLKSSIFSPKNNFWFYLLSCIFVIFIVLFNNPYNFLCVSVPIIFATIQCLVITKFEKKVTFELENLEVKFSREKNRELANEILGDVEKQSYGFAYFILGKNLLGIFCFFIASYLTLILFDAFNLINIFFLIFTQIFLYQNLIPIFSYENRKIEEKFNYLRFINLVQ